MEKLKLYNNSNNADTYCAKDRIYAKNENCTIIQLMQRHQVCTDVINAKITIVQ